MPRAVGVYLAIVRIGADGPTEIASWGEVVARDTARTSALDRSAIAAHLRAAVRTWRAGEHDEARAWLEPSPRDGALVSVPLAREDDDLLVLGGRFDPLPMAELLVRLRDPIAAMLEDRDTSADLDPMRAWAEALRAGTPLPRPHIDDAIVGAEHGLKHVLEYVDRVAATSAPVLVFGETGSGKEVVARTIHARSLRANRPFLRVNCGAIPPELVDSELFGHERGSFTGAVSTRSGWFERADGGTLFLDEIAELSPAAQVRLLRVLQDGSYERVGGERPMLADVRIIAATHRDLREMVEEGTFREDLWYRISVFPVHLPPLRARREDIPALARMFAARHAKAIHARVLEPTERDLERLAAHDWPGNVRELGALVERAVILGRGETLDIEGAFAAVRPPTRDIGTTDLAGVTRRAIESALERATGRIEGQGGAAEVLGIHPATLRSRMRKLGIDWRRFRPNA